MLEWKVSRPKKTQGLYYVAKHQPTGRNISLGYMPGDPEPAIVVQRLLAIPEALSLTPDDLKRRLMAGPRSEIDEILEWSDTTPPSPPKEPASTPAPVPRRPGEKGEMLLRDYISQVWGPYRKTRVTPHTWKGELWGWDYRILPVLGDTRLCDLTTALWDRFLADLQGLPTGPLAGKVLSPRTRTMARNAYRVALAYAVELEWLPSVHRMSPIVGGKKRALPDPEPMSASEIIVFLDHAPTPTHRALFATQIGNGLRPGEVIRIRWEDVDWPKKSLLVRGTKNEHAGARVPMSPLTLRELFTYWRSLGSPSTGIAFERTKGRGGTHSKRGVGGGAFPSYPSSTFRRTAKKSGLNEGRTRDLFPYIARHTFATLSAELGIDRAMAKKMMRHATTSTVMEDAYIRVSMASVAQAYEGFDVPERP